MLWQAVVGGPSTGKSAALTPMRRLLEVIDQERRLGDEERRAAHAECCKKIGEDTPFMPLARERATLPPPKRSRFGFAQADPWRRLHRGLAGSQCFAI